MKECHFCDGFGLDRGDDVSVCRSCWALLQSPATALPLIRGTVSMKLRGTMPKERLDEVVNEYMGMLSTWQRKDPGS